MIGKTLEHFRIIDKLGAGGMGVVYRARDERLDRDVAIKVLPASLLSDELSRNRLLREARVASALNHPNICTVYTVAEVDGQVYIAMEYVAGQSLNTMLAEHRLRVDQVVDYAAQLADALHHAHEHGVVHRDLKAANVMITPDGRVKVLDFGLAKRMPNVDSGDVARSHLSLTASGMIVGTPAYMAPEQLLGDAADARSDIWALGVVTYEMLAGASPFTGASGFDLIASILNNVPPPLSPLVPQELHEIIARCLAKEPAHRYQRASDVRASLQKLRAELATTLPAQGEERRSAAILYSDLLNVRPAERTGKPDARESSREHRRLFRSVIPNHGGREMKTTGDAFVAEFASPLNAVRCAIDIQTAFAGRNAGASPENRGAVRIGLHVGEVIHRETEVAGDAVDVATRLEPLASAGGICLSEDLARQIEGSLDLPLQRWGQHSLPHVAAPIDVYSVVLPWNMQGSLSGTPEAPWFFRLRARSRWQWLAVAGAVASVALLAVFDAGGIRSALSGRSAQPNIRSLLVLPLTNLGGDPAQEFVADGMTEAIISELSRIGGLSVVSRTTAMQYKGSKKPLRQIVDERGVDGVVEGSVLKEGGTIRVTLQLIDGRTDKSVWGQSFDRGSGGIMALHSEVVRAIANEVKVKLSPQEQQALLASSRTVNPEAYEAYLKGRMYWYRQTPQDVDRALQYFQFAVQKDSTFPLAFLGIGYVWTYYASAGLMPPTESAERLIAANKKVLELDSTIAEAHEGLADFRFYYEWDWAGAEREYRRAIELKPNSVEMRLYYWEYLAAMNRLQEAEEQVKRCLELDPLNTYVQMIYGMFLLSARRFDEAVTEFSKILAADADFGPARLGLWVAHHHLGNPEPALAFAKDFFIKWGDDEMAKVLSAGQARGGYRGAMRAAAEKLAARSKDDYVLAIQVAQLYAFAGQNERALDWLEKAYERRETGLVKLQIDPDWDTLRGEPRFQQLKARMNFPSS